MYVSSCDWISSVVTNVSGLLLVFFWFQLQSKISGIEYIITQCISRNIAWFALSMTLDNPQVMLAKLGLVYFMKHRSILILDQKKFLDLSRKF